MECGLPGVYDLDQRDGVLLSVPGVTPGIAAGAISLGVLVVAVVAWNKGWARTYIVTATIAEFFNVLVLIVQSFEKIEPASCAGAEGDRADYECGEGGGAGVVCGGGVGGGAAGEVCAGVGRPLVPESSARKG